ncbi:MAG TPA: hypothetical protein DD670_18070 [Planctomycetaceae bacterium]|nr:hypothetical protein [Planctomycetaceae bacterium]
MAGDAMKRVRAGDRVKLSADIFNTLLDTARIVRSGQQNLDVTARPATRERNVVLVKNVDAGQKDWPAFAPVVVAAPGGSPASWALGFSEKPYLAGNQPTGNNPTGPGDVIGVTQEPIRYGSMGRVCIAGVSCALVRDDFTASSQSFVGVQWDSTTARLVFTRSGQGTIRFLLRLDDVLYQDGIYNDLYFCLIDCSQQVAGPLWGKLDASLAHDDTTGVTVSLYIDPTTDSGRDIENVLPPPWMTDGTIALGSWVEPKAWGGSWYAIPMPSVQIVTTDLQVDETNHELQKKSRKVFVPAVEEETDWVVWHAGEDCD